MLQTAYMDRKCHMCETQHVGHEQHMMLRCAALQHVCYMFPELDFTLPSLAVFLFTYATNARLYHYLAKVVRLADFVSMHPP